LLNYISPLPAAAFAARWPRRVALLGSTGSIGGSALDVLAAHPEYFSLVALAGGKNVRRLAQQAAKWKPPCLAVQDEAARRELAGLLDYRPEILVGQAGYVTLAALPEADLVLSAQVGAAGLRGTLSAVRAGKVVALANKESLVLAGGLVRSECAASGASILPVDSEHNAIFQCLLGQTGVGSALPRDTEPAYRPAGAPENSRPSSDLKRLILTASGGPFRGRSKAFLDGVGKQEALAHPTWSMGAKITIDSATLMNKGLEVIEACHLYGLPPEEVAVAVHPQSVVHSLIEYRDGSQLAQLGAPDMRLPISVCLGWPYRLTNPAPRLNLLDRPPLTFEAPDNDAFPALELCRRALSRDLEQNRGRTIALNAANEVAITLFMGEKLSFTGISALVAEVLEKWPATVAPGDIDDILELDAAARRMALRFVPK
jgi:1-deoxy-D-xylulose-5-phosphate reductoisomerase